MKKRNKTGPCAARGAFRSTGEIAAQEVPENGDSAARGAFRSAGEIAAQAVTDTGRRCGGAGSVQHTRHHRTFGAEKEDV